MTAISRKGAPERDRLIQLREECTESVRSIAGLFIRYYMPAVEALMPKRLVAALCGRQRQLDYSQ